MVIYGVGDTEEEAMADHNKNLEQFLRRCRQRGVKLNEKKVKVMCKEIPYMGHLVTAGGLKPDPDKVEVCATCLSLKTSKVSDDFVGL